MFDGLIRRFVIIPVELVTTENLEITEMEMNELTGRVIGCAIDVHRELGPGLLESTYERCLAHELDQSGIKFQTQYPIPVLYRGLHIDCGYRLDVFVEDQLIVELKSVESLQKIHEAQLLTHMKLSQVKLGLLINFNVNQLRDGIRRLVI